MDIVTNIFDNIASIPGVFPSCLDKYISSVSWGRPPTAQARPDQAALYAKLAILVT